MSNRSRVSCQVGQTISCRIDRAFNVGRIALLEKCQIDRISCQIHGAFSNVRSIACSMSHRPRLQCQIDHGVFPPCLAHTKVSPSGLTFSESDVFFVRLTRCYQKRQHFLGQNIFERPDALSPNPKLERPMFSGFFRDKLRVWNCSSGCTFSFSRNQF